MSRGIDLHGANWTMTHPQTHAGMSGEEEPRSFDFGVQQLDVLEILDHWASDHRYYKVRAKGNKLYVLRHTRGGDAWEVTQLTQHR